MKETIKSRSIFVLRQTDYLYFNGQCKGEQITVNTHIKVCLFEMIIFQHLCLGAFFKHSKCSQHILVLLNMLWFPDGLAGVC